MQRFQRGRIYSWRRRMLRFSTGFDSIWLSLRIGIRPEACITSRKLTAGSDRIFDDLARNFIPPDDMWRWMSQVIAGHPRKVFEGKDFREVRQAGTR